MPPGAPLSDPATALEAYDPARFGFVADRGGWRKEVPSLGPVAVAPLSWRHAQAPSFAAPGGGDPTNALGLLVALEIRVWGMPPEDVVPANMLAVLPDTGGSVLVAYDPRLGFTADGWLGFAIAAGARSGVLVSHMLGVHGRARGRHDLGWHLKLLQAHAALRSGHHAAAWTFDPMRGANARLNLEKLGAVADAFTIDKYGPLPSDLYGSDVPTDRLTARWDLHDPATAARLHAVAAGTHRFPTPADVVDLPEATAARLPEIAADPPPRLRYRVPADIDRLARDDPATARRWRDEMRRVMAALLPTVAVTPAPAGFDPLDLAAAEHPGGYLIDGFATGPGPSGDRENWYLLRRRTP